MKHISIIFTALSLSFLVISSCSSDKKRASQSAGSDDERVERVKVMELQRQVVSRSVEYPATLLAHEEVHLAPASPGRIEAIYVEAGDRFTKDQLLVQMDRTQLHQAEIQMKNLEVDLHRLDTLSKYGSVAQQQLDQLQTQYEIAKTNVTFLKENTQLLAPFSGVVSNRYFEAGELYSGAPNTQVGKAAVLSLVQIDRLKIMVPLSERYFPQVKSGMEAKIVVDTYPDKEFSGRVVRVYPTIDPTSRTFNAEVRLNNSEGLLRPGMFARIILDLDTEEAILLPGITVLKMQGSNERYLFKVVNGKAERVAVTIGKRYDDDIEVFSNNLSVGDNIVISGQARLIDGVSIEVVR